MSSRKSPNTLARQWHILKQLPSRPPGLSTARIMQRLAADGFHVTKRTVERDLEALSAIFPLMCQEERTPYHWHFMPEAGLQIPGITVTGAISMALIQDTLTPLLPTAIVDELQPHFEHARKTLSTLCSHNPDARWPEKVRQVPPTLPFLAPPITPAVLEIVQNALLNNRKVEVRYTKPGERTAIDLTLSPLGLIQRGSVSYLVATAFAYDDVRLYALHRIAFAVLTDDIVSPPPDFSLDHFLQKGGGQFGNNKHIRLDAAVAEDLAHLLLETPLSEDMTITKRDSTFYLRATVIDSWQLHWWILSQYSKIQILRPKALRNLIHQRLSDTLALYS